MTVKEIDSKKLFKEYLLVVPYEEIDSSVNAKIKEIIPTVTLPGFRKGKAPVNIVKKKYENNVLNEVIGKIVEEKTKELLEEKKLKAFRQPRVEIKKYKKNENVELSIKIDIQPDIKIFPFDKIDCNKYEIDIDKKTYDLNFETFIKSQKKYIKSNSDRSLQKNDKVFVNISTNDQSVPDFLKTQNNIPIFTDSDYQVLPDISNKLIKSKVKIGDKINLSFDMKQVLKSENETNVEFQIEIISIEQSTDFKIDKEFLEKNNLKSEKELKENLNQNLLGQYNQHLKEVEKKQLMDNLDSKNKFDIPEGVLDEEFKIIWHRVEHAKKENKLDEDDKKLSDEKLKKRYEKIALRRVKLAILMQQIASEEKITVSEKELSEGMISYASQYPGQEKQIFEYFKNNPSSIESVRGPIFEKKIVDFILSKTKQIKKKITVKEFNNLQEKTFNYKVN